MIDFGEEAEMRALFHMSPSRFFFFSHCQFFLPFLSPGLTPPLRRKKKSLGRFEGCVRPSGEYFPPPLLFPLFLLERRLFFHTPASVSMLMEKDRENPVFSSHG